MIVSTKADIGDKVFFLAEILKVPCHICNGTGKISLGEPVKANLESPEKFYDSVHEEFAKNMMNIFLGETKEYKCPECNGEGEIRATGQKKYEIQKGHVQEISMVSSNSNTNISYTIIKDDGIITHKLQNEIWTSEENAVKRCYFLNLERRIYPIECIQISKDFAKTVPHNNKLMKRLNEWRAKRKFETEIYIDNSGKLFDGYTSYLIYRMLGITDVPVVIWPDKKEA